MPSHADTMKIDIDFDQMWGSLLRTVERGGYELKFKPRTKEERIKRAQAKMEREIAAEEEAARQRILEASSKRREASRTEGSTSTSTPEAPATPASTTTAVASSSSSASNTKGYVKPPYRSMLDVDSPVDPAIIAASKNLRIR